MSPALTGAVLLKCAVRIPAGGALFEHALRTLAADCVPLAESVAAHAALESEESYLYLFSRETAAISSTVLAHVVERAGGVPALAGAKIAAAKLVPVFDRPGASRTVAPLFHYVVEMDVEPAHESDLNAWYDKEHMPGLAACPGTVRARRFRTSCYDLTRSETLTTPPWLAVRGTAWSGRVRPNFRNLKKTMFKRLFETAL
jgi:hypothetical protein